MITPLKGRGRGALVLSGIFFGAYLLNVIIGKLSILWGDGMPLHIGDVGEFLLLFAASLFFVAAALGAEARDRTQHRHNNTQSGRRDHV